MRGSSPRIEVDAPWRSPWTEVSVTLSPQRLSAEEHVEAVTSEHHKSTDAFLRACFYALAAPLSDASSSCVQHGCWTLAYSRTVCTLFITLTLWDNEIPSRRRKRDRRCTDRCLVNVQFLERLPKLACTLLETLCVPINGHCSADHSSLHAVCHFAASCRENGNVLDLCDERIEREDAPR